MRRLTLLVLIGLLGVVSAARAYEGPALQTYDQTTSNIRVVMTTPSQIAAGGLTPFTLTAFVPVDADSTGLFVDMEIRKVSSAGVTTLATCSYEMLPGQSGTIIAIPCHRLTTFTYSPVEGAVSIFPYVVRHSRNVATEWVHDGFAHRVSVTALVDDGSEENDSFATAVNLGNSLTAFITDRVANDGDYFAFTVPIGRQTTRVKLDFNYADLDLYVYNAAHEVVAVSDGYTNHELAWFEVQPGATYFIRVVRFSGAPVFYELKIEHATLNGVTIVSGPGGAPNPVSSGGLVDVSGQAYDWNGSVPTLAWTSSCLSLPNNGSFADPSGSSTQWQAPVNGTGVRQTCTITLTASNGVGPSDSASYLQFVDANTDILSFIVTPTGTPNPVGPDGQSLLDVLVGDSMNHPVMYEWSDSCAFTQNGTFVPNRYERAPVWIAPPNTLGLPLQCTLTVTAFDAFNHSVTASTTIFVPAADVVTIASGPTATPGTTASNGTIALTATASDSLSHTVNYSWSDVCSVGPNGTFSNASIQSPTWTAPVNATGTAIACVITVTASDGFGHFAWKSVSVVVNSLPDLVTVATPAAALPANVNSQALTSLSVDFSDSLAHPLAFGWSDTCTGGLTNGTFLPNASTEDPQWLAPANATGATQTCTLTVVATDPLGHFAVSSVDIDVLSVPDAVTIVQPLAATPNPVASQGTVALTLLATDSLGHALNYAWSVTGCTGGLAPGAFIPNTAVAQPTWQAPVNATGGAQTCTISVTIDDGNGNSTSTSIVVTVNDEPHAITITSGPGGLPNPVASAGLVAVSVTASDPLHALLGYAWQAQCLWAPDNGVFTPLAANTASLAWQAPQNTTNAPQFCTMTVTITDGVLPPVVVNYQQWVTPEDTTPPVHEIQILVGPSGSPNPAPSQGGVVLNLQASDTFGHDLTYLWSPVCLGLSSTGSFSPSASHPTPIWTAPENRTGMPQDCVLTVTISDGQGLTVVAPVTITVNSVPDSVTITAGPTATPNPVASQGLVDLSVTAVDSLDHLLNYAWQQPTCPGLSNGGVLSNGATATPTWTAPLNDTGTSSSCTVSVTVHDGNGHSATRSATIIVNSIPDVVTITSGPLALPSTVTSAGLVALSVMASDSVHHALSYQWNATCVDLPASGSFPSGNAAAAVSWTAPINATPVPRTCTLNVVVSDGQGQTASASVAVTVQSVGQVITITAGPGGSLNPVVSGGQVNVFVSAIDTLGRPLTHTWSASCPGVLGSNGAYVDSHAASTTWTAPVNLTGQAQTCLITVTVSDDLGNSVTVSYQQVVGTPPVIIVSGGSNNGGTVGSGGGIVIGVQGPDLPGQTLTYQWTANCPTLGSNGTFGSPTSATSTWTAPANHTGLPQTCVLTVTITDGQGQVQVASFTVIVDPLCLYTVDPTNAVIPAAGGNATFTVTVDPGCVWAAIPAAPWVAFNGTPQGTGNGSFVVSLSPTTEPGPRTSSVNVGGTQIEIQQLGKGYTYYLAEGATINHFFETRIALLNIDPSETATVAIDFQLKDTTTVLTHTLSLGSLQRGTIEVRKLAALIPALAVLDSAEFSTVVRSNVPLIVDRTMTWDDRGYGGHSETSIDSPSSIWYLAEGATIGNFELYYLIQNPNAAALDEEIEVTYLLPAPAAPIVRRYSMGPNTRRNIAVHLEPGLEDVEVSAIIRTPAGKPVIVERSMYLSSGELFYGAGHESTGIRQPKTQWFFAEGATGSFFDLFILIGNPTDQAAHVTATYLFDDGTTCSTPVGNSTQGGFPVVGPKSRHNIWVDLEVIPGCPRSLADAAVSTTITSDVPLVAERAMWWPGSTDMWAEAHNSAGAAETGVKWGFADGEQGFAHEAETYVLVANTSAHNGTARVTLHFEDGTSVQKDIELLANSRTNIPIGVVYDGARSAEGLPERSGFGFGTDPLNRRFGVIIESLPLGEQAAVQIVVERSTYWNGPGAAFWAAGTNALATKLE